MSLTTLTRHAQRYRELRESLHQKIGEAWSKGHTMSEIAEAVGLSRQRVHQIVQELSVAGTLPERKVKEEATTK
jgi:DNA-directed RNA polymerase sigma subunit (sigma70/sigma32)